MTTLRNDRNTLARGLLCASIGISSVATFRVAHAAETDALEEIVVTAERRVSDVQKTAASVSVRSGEELTAQGKYTTRQILEDIPGLTAVDNSSLNVGSADVQGNNITIRGITPATNSGAPIAPNGISPSAGVAVYVDGVYEGVGSGYDIERVELLRGPQGTLYGRSATAGVMAVHTRNPSLDGFAANVGVERGNFDLWHYNAGLNIPMGSTLAMRLSGDFRDQGRSYYNQARTGGMSKSKNGRGKLLWKPSEDFSLLVGFAYAENDTFSGGNSTTADQTKNLVQKTTTSGIFPSLKLQRQYWAELNWNLGPVTVTYLPAFRTWYQDDHLFVSPNFLASGAAQRQDFFTPKDDFSTHELRVASKDDAAVKWQAGVFYYDNKLRNTNHNFLTAANGTELAVLSDTKDSRDTSSLGFFAETTIPLTTSLRTTLGARYDDTKVLVNQLFYNNKYALCGTSLQANAGLPPGATCTGVAQASVLSPTVPVNDHKVKFKNFNYKVRLEYDLTQKNMVFGMISTGFRPGDSTISNGEARDIPAEKLTSFEVGSKNRFFDDSLQVNVGLYYYNYQGFGTAYNKETATSSTDYAGISNRVALNVPAKNYGGELELLYQLTSQDRVGFNGSYTQSSWYDQDPEFKKAMPQTKRAMTPYTLTANYEHTFNLPGGSTLSGRIDGRYEAAHRTANLHVDYLRKDYDKYAHVGARTIGNLSGAWASSSGRYSVSGYVRNFTNVKYTTITVAATPSLFTVAYSDPRTYGAMVNVRF